jgi:hypothetical protein
VDHGDHLFNGEPRLRLICEREFVPVVPFRLDEAPRTSAQVLAPVDQLGPLLSQQVPVVTGNDMQSMLAAFNKRCNFISTDTVPAPIVKSAKKLAGLVFPKVEPFNWTQDIFDRWISKFNSDKRTRMLRALNNLHDVDFRLLNTKSLMVKGEVLLKRNDPSWAPRVIYVGSDEYNVLTGPIMDEFNKRLSCHLDQFSSPEVEVILAYAKQDTEIADFLHGKDRYFEGDFSSNDRSQLSSVTEIFAHWLKRCGAPSWFVRFYKKNSLQFKVVSYDYGISATIQNQLATGGTDTTGRNSVWNLCLWYSFCEKYKIRKTKVAILGDDIAAGVDKAGISCVMWTAHCHAAGMKLKAFEKRFYCDLTFLSRFFVPVGDSNCMIPLIGKALCRFNARSNRNQDVSDDQYMAAKSLSYAYEFRHVGYLRDKFLARFTSTGVSLTSLRLTDLTWFARQNVSGLNDVLKACRDEPLVISELDFLDIIMAKYDIGLYDMDDLCGKLITSSTVEVFSDERYYAFSHEVE